jgi:L-seryl-tRNA(Ser) seleniumtransferase
MKQLSQLPGVDRMLEHREIKALVSRYGHELITSMIREVIADAREEVLQGNELPSIEQLAGGVGEQVQRLVSPSLKPVINGTGIVLHTNLGRAPLGEIVLKELEETAQGYTNLEYDLETAARGKRRTHIVPLLKVITGAEDAAVVNNNAAALMLALHTLARGREVIVSRGELVEIGGSFRIPEIMAASGAIMNEIGTTNKTHLKDYQSAVNERTALILKVHKSNYAIRGFTGEVPLKTLAELGRSVGLPVLYDIGSGLLRKPRGLPLESEPDVRTSLVEGADLVAFSGDKLLGGPQAGIIVGKKELIDRLNSAPMMRALRVGKMTLAVLSTVLRAYLDETGLRSSIPLFTMLEQSKETLKSKAEKLVEVFAGVGVTASVVESTGQCGGGTLPLFEIPSFAVKIVSNQKTPKERSKFAEDLFHYLMQLGTPIIGILRQGEFLLDTLTLDETDFSYITSTVSKNPNKRFLEVQEPFSSKKVPGRRRQK